MEKHKTEILSYSQYKKTNQKEDVVLGVEESACCLLYCSNHL